MCYRVDYNISKYKIESNLNTLIEKLDELSIIRINSILNDSERLFIAGIIKSGKNRGAMGFINSKFDIYRLATMVFTLTKLHPDLLHYVRALEMRENQGHNIIGKMIIEDRSEENREERNRKNL